MASSKDALHLTTRAIDRRAFHFRNLVILIVVVSLGFVVGAIVERSFQPLLGWLTMIPLCGGFLILDSYLVGRWRRIILAMWTDEALNLDDFLVSITSLRMLPKATLDSMLATLPASQHGDFVDRLAPERKHAIVDLCLRHHRGLRNATVVATLAYTIGAIFFVWAIMASDWRPVLGCLATAAIVALGRLLSAQPSDVKTLVERTESSDHGLALPATSGGCHDSAAASQKRGGATN